jgi:hypothetical protein
VGQSRRALGEIIVDCLEAARHDSEVFSLDEAVDPQFVEKGLNRR